MTRTLRSIAFTVFSVVAPFVCAAATNDFYGTLLQRGIAHVNAGSFEAGARELRIAAFGLVDNIPQFEVAQIYLAIASEKLGREADARHASQRVLAAERIEPRYASLQIDAATHDAFERVVNRILTSDQVAILHTRPVTSPAPSPITATDSVPHPQPQPRVQPPAPIVPQPVAPITPKPVAPPTPRSPAPIVAAPTSIDVSKRLTDADFALMHNELSRARAIYREVVDVSPLDHASLIRIAEGAYRSRDFATAIRAFERAGAFRKGEEPYRYYLAVSLYETGRFAAAKRELAAALPFIEITPDVQRYRVKIEGAIE